MGMFFGLLLIAGIFVMLFGIINLIKPFLMIRSRGQAGYVTIAGFLVIIVSMIGGITTAVNNDTESQVDKPKKEAKKSDKEQRIEAIEEAFKMHKPIRKIMNSGSEFAKEGNEEEAKKSVESAKNLHGLALSQFDDLEPPKGIINKEKSDLFMYQTSVRTSLTNYSILIDTVQKGVDEGMTMQQAFNYYDDKAGEVISELDKLESKLKDFK